MSLIEPKVFGIGFHKTGTSSLADALTILGYRVTGTFGLQNPDIGANAVDLATEIVPRFDAFQDNPWPIIFRELDELYPGSKFILTVRPSDAWVASLVRHFGKKTTAMREWIYGGHGYPEGNEEIYLERYERHNSEVREHFADRPEDLLEFRITEGDGWERICPFLGHDPPQADFPHSNTAAEREKRAGRPRPEEGGVRRLVRRWLGRR